MELLLTSGIRWRAGGGLMFAVGFKLAATSTPSPAHQALDTCHQGMTLHKHRVVQHC